VTVPVDPQAVNEPDHLHATVPPYAKKSRIIKLNIAKIMQKKTALFWSYSAKGKVLEYTLVGASRGGNQTEKNPGKSG